MKKLLSIILALVCIIPTMAVSFSVSAKETKKSVPTANISVCENTSEIFTVSKTKGQQKYNFGYTISNNQNKNIVLSKNNTKTQYKLTVTGKKLTTNKKPTVSVYYKNGNKKVVVKKYVVSVTKFRVKIKNQCKSIKMDYSNYLNSSKRNEWVDFYFKLYKNIPSMLNKADSNAKYRIETKNKNVVKLSGNKIVTTAVGNATYTLYSITDNKETKLGNFKVQVNKISMNKLAGCNAEMYDDGVFYNDVISLNLKKSKTLNAYKEIKSAVLNSSYTGIKFKPSDYKLTYSIKNTSVATVNSKGVITAKKSGETMFGYTIKFKDGSVFKDFTTEVNVY